jgi:hypothetical protein
MSTNNIAPWPAYASAYNGFANFAVAPTSRAYPLYFYTEYENPNLRSAPVISLVSNGDQRAEISFQVALDGIIDNVGDYRYVVFVDGVFHGFYRANAQSNGVANGTFTIGGLINDVPNTIQIQTAHARYNEDGTIYRAERSARSNIIQVNPLWNLAPRSFLGRIAENETCDIINSSVGSYFDSNFNGLTQYSFNGNSYDPIAFNPNVSVAVAYATIHLRARILDSSRDTTSQNFIDYNIKNIDVTLGESFDVCIDSDGQRGIARAFNAERDRLGKNNPDMNSQQEAIIEYNLRREYIKAKPLLAKKLQKTLQQNADTLINSLPTYRSLLNILSFSSQRATLISQDFKIYYAATIFINPKIIAAHSTTSTPFDYSLTSLRGRILNKGRNNLAILTNYPQNFSYFSYIPLSSLLTVNEVLGDVPTS